MEYLALLKKDKAICLDVSSLIKSAAEAHRAG
jgi:hypothetical protein